MCLLVTEDYSSYESVDEEAEDVDAAEVKLIDVVEFEDAEDAPDDIELVAYVGGPDGLGPVSELTARGALVVGPYTGGAREDAGSGVFTVDC